MSNQTNHSLSSTSRLRHQSGFSLIELMVVVSIMAILAVIGLGGFSNAQKKARDSRRKADIKTIQNAMISSSDVGGNLSAEAARMELGGSFPEDPRRDSTGKNDKYFLFAPLVVSSADPQSVIDGINESIFYIQNADANDGNVGLVCAVLEAPNSGNAADARSAQQPEIAKGKASGRFLYDDFETAGASLAGMQQIVVAEVNSAGSLNIVSCGKTVAAPASEPTAGLFRIVGTVQAQGAEGAEGAGGGSTAAANNCNLFCATF
jgi:prepilin-type N-terminal cleavage/methylation domain-containing protein